MRFPAGAPVCLCLLLALPAPGCTHVCDADSCADGCCDDQGVCWVNPNAGHCGLGGAQCATCDTNGTACVAGRCQAPCGAESCRGGCCDTQGLCHASSKVTCGLGGDACSACPISGDCVNGYCCNGELDGCGAGYAPCCSAMHLSCSGGLCRCSHAGQTCRSYLDCCSDAPSCVGTGHCQCPAPPR
jgi:hypothetical protein